MASVEEARRELKSAEQRCLYAAYQVANWFAHHPDAVPDAIRQDVVFFIEMSRQETRAMECLYDAQAEARR